MATVARLLPRHWDGRRLLQFLTGLALIALAFAVPAILDPADEPAEAPVTIITTVDTPLPPGLPVGDAPEQVRAAGGQAALALEAEGAGTAAAAAGSTQAAGSAQAAGNAEATGSTNAEVAGNAEAAGNADGDTQGAAPVDASAVQGLAGLPVQGRSGGKICFAAGAAVGGSTQRAHSERGPPRA